MSAAEVAQGIKSLIRVVRNSAAGRQGKAPKLLVVAPPPIGKLNLLAGIYGDAPLKSKDLSHQINMITQLLSCQFVDAGEVVTSSTIDGVHWDAEQHRRFAEAVYQRIKVDFLK
ncbi:MAG: hypothetical protein HKN89_02020 [Eudoraea sp.]|nr:hypothetical protein [Eudoraea sp.]